MLNFGDFFFFLGFFEVLRNSIIWNKTFVPLYWWNSKNWNIVQKFIYFSNST